MINFVCKLCGKEFSSFNPVGNHLKKLHNISSQDYYDTWLKIDNEDICICCGKKKKFYGLSKGYRKYCSNICQMKYEQLNGIRADLKKQRIEKINECLEKYGEVNKNTLTKLTYLKHYGIDNPQKLDEVISKREQTCLQKYGVKSYSQTQDFLDKYKTTSIAKYGVENISSLPDIKTNIKNTIKLKYKTNSYSNTDEYKVHMKKYWLQRFKETYGEQCKCDILDYINNTFKFCCHYCNMKFQISKSTFYKRLNNNEKICTYCNPFNSTSYEQLELYELIKFIYPYNIILNDRTILNGKELDIYLPDLKLAFEFDGTYWHADQRFYNENKKVKAHCAKDIWEKDIEKEKLCKCLGITLIRVNEYDWNNLIKLNSLENIYF